MLKKIKKVLKNLAPKKQNLRTELKSQHHQKKKPETTKPVKKTGKTKTDKPKTDKPKTDKPKTEKPKTDKPKTDKPKTDKPKTDKPKTDKAATDKPGAKHEDKKPSKRLAKLKGKKVQIKEVAPGRALLRKQRLRNKSRFLEASLADQFEKGRLYARITSRPGQCGHADGYILEGEELSFYMKKILTKKKK
jgi:ribosomal protein S8E